MKEQPEALWLADALEGRATRAWTREEVAAKLRRLHAENETLRQQHLEAHRTAAALASAMTAISLRTHLGGEVAEYGDVVDAVRRLHAVNAELLHALHCISLAAQDSGSTREGMGLYARAAIAKAEGEQA